MTAELNVDSGVYVTCSEDYITGSVTLQAAELTLQAAEVTAEINARSGDDSGSEYRQRRLRCIQRRFNTS